MSPSTDLWRGRGDGSARRGIARLFLFALLIGIVVVSFPPALPAAEVIRNFTSIIRVETDGSLLIEERISVVSEGREIRRGIYRDFPTDYVDGAGHRYRVDFEVEMVMRNGRPEPYHTERRGNGVRVYIGDADILLPRGDHDYVILYRTTRQLGHFEGFDEIYWNVTGNGWVFPIERARAEVRLPLGASVLQYAAYTGYQGEQGADFTSERLVDGMAFETTRPLAPREGLTIAVAWPEGFVARPSEMENLAYLLGDNRILVAGGLGILLLFSYYFIVWWRVGRDPAPGTIIPLYEPPVGYSPAAMRYIRNMGYDDKTFSAAILSMAVKGYLTIEEPVTGSYTLRKTGADAPLSLGEKAIARHLFAGGLDAIELKQANHVQIRRARDSLKDWLRTEYEGVYFRTNRNYFYPGVAISLVVLALMIIFAPDPAGALFLTVWLTFWTIGLYFMLRVGIRAAMNVITRRDASATIGVAAMALIALPFTFGAIFGLILLAEVMSWSGVAIFLIIQIINLGFYNLLKAPTSFGRQAMDKFAGFADFLSVTEKDRMNYFNPPDRTPELFERYLPFALALDVENQWAEQFSRVFAAVRGDGQGKGGYRPRWYHGTSFSVGDFTGFSAGISSSLTGAISASSSPPGRSSGSGGGGSSGGGGGGGGGGGW